MDKLVMLELVERLKNCDFILEDKMAELKKIKIQNKQTVNKLSKKSTLW